MRTVNSLEEISDGRVYGLNDMVRADCQDCKGCSDCCKGMGKSIILDPYDIYRLTIQEEKTMEELLVDKVELSVVDGIILPNLKMVGEEEKCAFLDDNGRCSIHSNRPGLCRLFPLGRCYEDGTYSYFLQNNECSNKKRLKIKVSKWIDTPDIKKNQKFILDWHYFIKEVEEKLKGVTDENIQKQWNMYILQTFYFTPYHANMDFYEQFFERLAQCKRAM